MDLLRRALGPERIPELLETIRQEKEREQEIASMWRKGEAVEAIDPRPALPYGEVKADSTGRRYYAGLALWLDPARPPASQ